MSRAKKPSGIESFLHTKLMPPRLRPSAIPRQDLMKRLDWLRKLHLAHAGSM